MATQPERTDTERMSHTAGPWRVVLGKGPESEIDCWIETGSGATLAQIFPICDSPENNARLIAAAPELLETLRDLVIACNMPRGPGQGLTESQAITSANEAIALASPQEVGARK